MERPATLCIPLLLVTFSVGNGAAYLRPDFFDGPDRLLAERLLAAAVRHPDLPAGVRLAGIVDAAKRPAVTQRIANVYLACVASGILACVVRITTAYMTADADGGRWQPGVVRSPACAAQDSRSHRLTRGEPRRGGSPGSDAARLPRRGRADRIKLSSSGPSPRSKRPSNSRRERDAYERPHLPRDRDRRELPRQYRRRDP